MDFKGLSQSLLNQSESLVSSWLPGGKRRGQEWVCGDLSGSAGTSCSVNLSTGKWADFSTGDKGGDLVSLYAAINNIDQKDAYNKLSGSVPVVTSPKPTRKAERFIPPPEPARRGQFTHPTMGKPTDIWKYQSIEGATLFYIARYDLPDGSKELRPLSYTEDGRWVSKGWPAPRPLYNLPAVSQADTVLIVEGEKAAEAAKKTCFGHPIAVTTWPNGTNAWDKTDWSPLYGKRIFIWPDHDEPGRVASAKIASHLLPKCPRIQVFSTLNDNLSDGWDAADAKFTYEEFLEWSVPRSVTVELPTPEPMPELAPMPTAEDAPIPNNLMVIGDEAIEAMTTKLSTNVNSNVQRCGLQSSRQGIPIENLLNACRILEVDFSGRFWFDEFYRSFYTSMNGKPEPLSDSHIYDLQVLMQSNYGLRKISKATVKDAIVSISYRDRRHAAKEWFTSLKWDGLARMDDFFGNACGADDNQVNQAISRYFFVSIVARLFGPDIDPIYGNKVDSMLVIEGDQGLAKGMLLKSLVGRNWHFEVSKGTKDKDFFQEMRGKLIAEVAELASFEGQNLDSIKRVISCQTDRLRVSYGTEAEDFDRTCVFVGTTNKDEYLTDETGNRRFLPVRINKVDLEYVLNNRDQVFAEALAYYRTSYKTWWVIPRDALAQIHASRMVAGVAQELQNEIECWVNKLPSGVVTISEIWKTCLQQDLAKITKKNRDDIAMVLKNLNWVNRVEYIAAEKRSIRHWVKPRQVDYTQ